MFQMRGSNYHAMAYYAQQSDGPSWRRPTAPPEGARRTSRALLVASLQLYTAEEGASSSAHSLWRLWGVANDHLRVRVGPRAEQQQKLPTCCEGARGRPEALLLRACAHLEFHTGPPRRRPPARRW